MALDKNKNISILALVSAILFLSPTEGRPAYRLNDLSRATSAECKPDNVKPAIEFSRKIASKDPVQVLGTALFKKNCVACHGKLGSTTIRGKSASEIEDAISEVKKMSALFTGKFDPNSIAALAMALNSPLLVASPEDAVTDTDKAVAGKNPKQYALAKKYFDGEHSTYPAKRIFRLTRVQMDNAVRSILPKYFRDSISKTMPKDPLQTNYEFSDNLAIQSANFPQISAWISDIAERVRKDPAGVIDCKSKNDNPACLSAQATAFINRAFRSSAEQPEIQAILNFYATQVQANGFEQATGDLVEVVLNSPYFLFRNEVRTESSGKLVNAELVQGLSFTMADTSPAALGVDSAMDPGAAADKIIGSPQARSKLLRFFLAWLEIKEPNSFKLSSDIFPRFTQPVASSLVTDFRKTVVSYLSRPDPKLRELTHGNASYPSKDLEFIYQSNIGNSAGDTPVPYNKDQRLGILSHPAFIASLSGPTSTRLIKRGVFWVRKVMCMDLNPPPVGLDTTIQPSTSVTERKRIESATGQKKCAGCHEVINPFGFVLENYDPMGAWRSMENGFPIDARVAMNDVLEDGPAAYSSPVESLNSLLETDRFRQCFVRQTFRFYMGRNEEESDDPVLREMFYSLKKDDSLFGLLKALAKSKEFQYRTVR